MILNADPNGPNAIKEPSGKVIIGKTNDSSIPTFNIVGIVTFGIILWTVSQNATGQARSIVNGFLGVLLLSMILLNWSKIKPIFFKS